MIRFSGTVEPTRSTDDNGVPIYFHPEGTVGPNNYPDATPEGSGIDSLVEEITLSGTPEGKYARAYIYEAGDRYYVEVRGSVVDVILGHFDDLETAWMRIETTDFEPALPEGE